MTNISKTIEGLEYLVKMNADDAKSYREIHHNHGSGPAAVNAEEHEKRERYAQAALSLLKGMGWIEIDDPRVEEWKDGRPVDLMVPVYSGDGSRKLCNFTRMTDCTTYQENSGEWRNPDGLTVLLKDVGYAMLPPSIPKPKESAAEYADRLGLLGDDSEVT